MQLSMNNEDYRKLSDQFAQTANQMRGMSLNVPSTQTIQKNYNEPEEAYPRNKGFAALPRKIGFSLGYAAIRALGVLGNAVASEANHHISKHENRERHRQEWEKFSNIRKTAAELGKERVSEIIDEVAEGSWEGGGDY